MLQGRRAARRRQNRTVIGENEGGRHWRLPREAPSQRRGHVSGFAWLFTGVEFPNRGPSHAAKNGAGVLGSAKQGPEATAAAGLDRLRWMVGAPKMPPTSSARTIRHKVQAASGEAMPQTLFDKISEAHLVGRRADGRDLVYIDRHVLHELHRSEEHTSELQSLTN